MTDDPADRYRDKVAPEHKLAMQAIGFVRQLLEPHREQFEILDKAERDSHSFGHILDPTLYRDMIHSKSFAQQMRMVRAALAFMNEIRAVAKEIEGKTEGDSDA